MRLASIAQRTFSVRDIARPVMLEVLAVTGETVDLSMLSGDNRVVVDVLENAQPPSSHISHSDMDQPVAGARCQLLRAFKQSNMPNQDLPPRAPKAKTQG